MCALGSLRQMAPGLPQSQVLGGSRPLILYLPGPPFARNRGASDALLLRFFPFLAFYRALNASQRRTTQNVFHCGSRIRDSSNGILHINFGSDFL